MIEFVVYSLRLKLSTSVTEYLQLRKLWTSTAPALSEMEVEGFVKFSIKTNSVPQSFSIFRGIEELIKTPIQRHDFRKEHNVSQLTQKKLCFPICILFILFFSPIFLQLIDKYKNLRIQQQKSNEVDLINFENNALATSSVVFSSESTRDPSISAFEHRINQMMSETKQEKDVCRFYLESTNWDLNEAIELFKSMTEG